MKFKITIFNSKVEVGWKWMQGESCSTADLVLCLEVPRWWTALWGIVLQESRVIFLQYLDLNETNKHTSSQECTWTLFVLQLTRNMLLLAVVRSQITAFPEDHPPCLHPDPATSHVLLKLLNIQEVRYGKLCSWTGNEAITKHINNQLVNYSTYWNCLNQMESV